MSITIEESGLTFGTYDNSKVFHIEKSQYYQRLSPHCVRCCEFILLRGNTLYFIEAKSSCPRTSGRHLPEAEQKNQLEKYIAFIREITDKMQHSLEIYGTLLLNRNGAPEELPDDFAPAHFPRRNIKLVLVINTNGGGWKPNPELQNSLQHSLHPICKIWKANPILIIDEETARKKGFIL